MVTTKVVSGSFLRTVFVGGARDLVGTEIASAAAATAFFAPTMFLCPSSWYWMVGQIKMRAFGVK